MYLSAPTWSIDGQRITISSNKNTDRRNCKIYKLFKAYSTQCAPSSLKAPTLCTHSNAPKRRSRCSVSYKRIVGNANVETPVSNRRNRGQPLETLRTEMYTMLTVLRTSKHTSPILESQCRPRQTHRDPRSLLRESTTVFIRV